MEQNTKQDIALMRYRAISPIITELGEEYTSFEAFFRDVASKGVREHDGTLSYYAPGTIKKWYQNYKKGGFDALIPKDRSDQGCSRKLDTDVQEQIRTLKEKYPKMSATAIHRQLHDNGSVIEGEISLSTVNRYVNRLKMGLDAEERAEMRRYEREHINEVWCGDTSVGPYLKTDDGRRHRVYIIALIDDASRFIVGIDVFFNDNFVNLMSVLKSAVLKFGHPKMLNFDNGSSFKNKQMDLLAARVGTVLHFDHPYSPTEKAKIERWFRTMKSQWMATLDINEFHSLDELRGSLLSYVQTYNQKVHSSLNGKSPQERYFSEPEFFHRISEEEIEKTFLLEIERRVSADGVISINNVEYEVDSKFAKQRITLRYAPDMNDIYVVEEDESLTPIRVLNKVENSKAKREKVRLSEVK